MRHKTILVLSIFFIYGLAVSGGNGSGVPLVVEIDSLRDTFRVDEPIRFRIKANQDFYLYVWNVDRRGKQLRPLSPSAWQDVKHYKAGRVYHVPEDVDYRADDAGNESLVFMASTYKADLDMHSVKGIQDLGNAGETMVPKKIVVEPARNEPQLTTPFIQQINVRVRWNVTRPICDDCPVFPPEPVAGNDIFEPEPEEETASEPVRTVERREPVRTVERREPVGTVERREPVRAGVTHDQKVYPFITTDKVTYDYDERMSITFGANGDGYVYLFLLEHDREPTFLKKYPVAGDTVYHARAVTEPPGGPQAVLAVFSEEDVPASQHLDMVPANYKIPDEEFVPKGLRILDETKAYPFALYGFEIR